MRKPAIATIAGFLASLAIASSALAMDCMNASKPDQTAGDLAAIDLTTGEVFWISDGLLQRLERGVVGADGSGLHGLLGLDFDGDHVVDVSTWIGVGPDGTHIAEPALINGPACRGLTSIEVYLTQCL